MGYFNALRSYAYHHPCDVPDSDYQLSFLQQTLPKLTIISYVAFQVDVPV